MRVTQLVAALAAVVAAVLGVSLVTAAPAAAAESGTWNAYGNTNPITSSPSQWQCAGSRTVVTSVIAQVCAIRSVAGSHVQGAVVVRNNRSSVYSVRAVVHLYTSAGTELGVWTCPLSGVAANSWSVCFGRTLAWSGRVRATGYANDVYLGTSPYV